MPIKEWYSFIQVKIHYERVEMKTVPKSRVKVNFVLMSTVILLSSLFGTSSSYAYGKGRPVVVTCNYNAFNKSFEVAWSLSAGKPIEWILFDGTGAPQFASGKFVHTQLAQGRAILAQGSYVYPGPAWVRLGNRTGSIDYQCAIGAAG